MLLSYMINSVFDADFLQKVSLKITKSRIILKTFNHAFQLGLMLQGHHYQGFRKSLLSYTDYLDI